MIGCALPVLPDKALDLVPPKVAAVERAWVEQDVRRKLAKLLSQPSRERYCEASLRSIQHLRRQDAAERALQQPLALGTRELELDGQRRRELHQPVVEERRSGL